MVVGFTDGTGPINIYFPPSPPPPTTNIPLSDQERGYNKLIHIQYEVNM